MNPRCRGGMTRYISRALVSHELGRGKWPSLPCISLSLSLIDSQCTFSTSRSKSRWCRSSRHSAPVTRLHHRPKNKGHDCVTLSPAFSPNFGFSAEADETRVRRSRSYLLIGGRRKTGGRRMFHRLDRSNVTVSLRAREASSRRH